RRLPGSGEGCGVEGQVEVADVMALRVQETGEGVGRPEYLHVPADRHAVHGLAAIEAVAGRMQAEHAAGERDRLVVDEALGHGRPRDDAVETGELLPVAVRLAIVLDKPTPRG